MPYRIDVPSLIASGVQRSVTDEFSSPLREYVQHCTADRELLRTRLTALLEAAPSPVYLPALDEAAIQIELLGAFMRTAYRVSPAYRYMWSRMGWNGQDGLEITAPLFRQWMTLGGLRATDWIRHIPVTPFLETAEAARMPRGIWCDVGHPAAIRHQWQVLREEYGLPAQVDCLYLSFALPAAPGSTGIVRKEVTVSAVDSKIAPQRVTRIHLSGAKSSYTEYGEVLANLQRTRVFDVLVLVEPAIIVLPMLCGGARWSARSFRMLMTSGPVPQALRQELRELRLCDYVVERVAGVGNVPALFQCKYERLHGFPFLQRLEQQGEVLLVTDLCGLTTPMFRIQATADVSVQAVPAQQCCCGRYDQYQWKVPTCPE